MYYTYMLRCSDNSIYTGITTDVKRRFEEHRGGRSKKAAKYTAVRQPVKIAAVWQSPTRETASRLEFYIKKLSKKKKENLICDNSVFTEYLGEKSGRATRTMGSSSP